MNGLDGGHRTALPGAMLRLLYVIPTATLY